MLSDPSDSHPVGSQNIIVLFVTSNNVPLGFSYAQILLFFLCSRETTMLKISARLIIYDLGCVTLGRLLNLQFHQL